MDDHEVKEILIKHFILSEQTFIRDVGRTGSKNDIQVIILDEPQYIVDKENKIKKSASLLSAKFNEISILSATEATTIAVELCPACLRPCMFLEKL
jgi:hypothetical protein